MEGPLLTGPLVEVKTSAITISPPQRLGKPYAIDGRKKYCYVKQEQIFHDDYRIIVQALRGSITRCTIYPEISDQGRLHYHGIVVIKDMIKWKKKALPRLCRLGFVKIKTNINDKWIEYCLKEWEQTKQILGIEQPITEILVDKPCKESNEMRIKRNNRLPQQTIYSYFASAGRGGSVSYEREPESTP